MYIRNQAFKDEETLLELLFDFSLGDPSEIIIGELKVIEKELAENEAYTQYFNSLTDEDDRIELQEEETSIRLAEKLMQLFDAFEVKDSKLYGVKQGQKELLYAMYLY